ncbi:MAG: hypothetical protein V7731_10010 [Amphritea sp.]
MKWSPSVSFLNTFIVLFILGILGILIHLSSAQLSNTETGLLSTILTILSVIAAWVVSHLYAASGHEKTIEEVKTAHQENLQTYALKAAEKVNNLSDQLNKLAVYIKEGIDNTDYDTVEEGLRSREERLHSSIHMIAMLKSVNDTSLSDWQGVIGDELEDQREERQEREVELIEIAEKLEGLWESNNSNESLDKQLSKQLSDIKTDVSHLMMEMTGSSIKLSKRPKSIRRQVDKSCIICNVDISYTQRAKPTSHKVVNCPNCSTKYVSKYSVNENGFDLEAREEIDENCRCPECQVEVIFNLDNYRGARKVVACNSCLQKFRVVRAQDGDVKMDSYKTSGKQLTQEFLDQVDTLLPIQPWPRNTHKEIAVELNCTPSQVSRATKELIKQGNYMYQIDGELFENGVENKETA